MAGALIRDNEAVSASLLICEAAAFYKSKNMSIYDGLLSLYDKYGYYKEDLFSIVLKGKEGAETILRMMDCLRKNPPKSLAGLSITEFRDYLVYESPDGVPKDNVLYVTFEDNSWFAIRPSETEPKIKIYLAVKGNSRDEADEKMDVFRASVKDLIEGITAS